MALGAFCMVLAWLLPNHYQPWASFYNELAMGVALLLLMLAKPSGRLGFPTATWAVAGVCVIVWLQWAFGQLAFSSDAWVSSLYLLAFAVAIGVGFGYGRHDARNFAALLSTAFIAGGSISSALGLAQSFHVGDFGIWVVEIAPGERAVANLAQPNNLATLIGFAMIGVWLLYEQRRLGATAAITLLILLMAGGTFTTSRTALLFVPAAFVVHRLSRKSGVSWRTGSAVLLCVMATQWLFALLLPLLTNTWLFGPAQAIGQRGVHSDRFIVWPVLLDAVSMSPWAGYGWLQTGAAQLAAADRHPSASELWLHGHNLFLEFIVWCGLPVGIALTAWVVGWFVSRVRSAAALESACGMAVVAVFAVHAMLELPHHYAFFLIPLGLWIGLVECRRGALSRGTAGTSWALAFVTLAVATAVVWDYRKVEADFWLMRFETRGIGPIRATQAAPVAPFLSSLTAFLRATRTPATPDMSPEQLDALRAIVTRYPYSPALYSYGTALALNHRLTDALSVFDKLRHIHGDDRYHQLRALLHRQVAEGTDGLGPLDAALPP